MMSLIRFLLPLFIFLSTHVYSQCSKGFQVDLQSENSVFATKIISDSKGNVFVAGYFLNTLSLGNTRLFSNGAYDIFIAKYDSVGKAIWAKNIGGTGDDFVSSVELIGDTSFIIGGRSSDNLLISCYSDKGIEKWTKLGGGSDYDDIESITSDNSGNIYVSGSFRKSFIFDGVSFTSTGGSDVLIMKYDINGNFKWLKTIGGSTDDWGAAIHVDKKRNILYSAISFTYSITVNGQSYISKGLDDIMLLKCDMNGNILDQKHQGGEKYDRVKGLKTDTNGNVYIVGQFANQITFDDEVLYFPDLAGVFLVKYNSNFKVEWARKPFLYGYTSVYDFCCDKNNNLYFTGSFTLSNNLFDNVYIKNRGNEDIYIAKYTSSGELVLVKSAGGKNIDTGYGIYANEKEEIYTAARYINNADMFGVKLLSTHTNSSSAIQKLDKYGFLPASFSVGPDINQALCKDSVNIGLDMDTSYSCAWTPNEGLANPFKSITKAKPQNTTQYILTVNAGPCQYKDTLNFVTYPLALPSDSIKIEGKLAYCSDAPAPELITFPKKVGVVNWYFQNFLISNDSTYQGFYSGKYYASLSNECGTVYTDTLTVERYDIPSSPDLIVTNSRNLQQLNWNSKINFGDYVRLSYDKIPEMKYQWNTGSKDDTLTVINSGMFHVTITDIHGCQNISPKVSVTVRETPWAITHSTLNQNDDMFLNLQFINKDTGYVVSKYAEAFKTIDGGYHWEKLNIPANTNIDFHDIHFFDNNNGIVLSEKGYYITSDGGVTWNYHELKPVLGSPNWALRDFEFYDRQNGYIVGSSGIVYRTTDGGLTWTQQSNLGMFASTNYYTVCPVSEEKVFYGGEGMNGFSNGTATGKIDASTDGGKNFKTKYSSWPSREAGWVYDIDFPSKSIGYAVDQFSGLLKTDDYGESWEYLTSLTSPVLSTVHFNTPAKGYVGGSDGFIAYTDNGGITWIEESSFNHGTILDLDFPNANVGYGVSHYGTVIKKGQYKISGFVTTDNIKSIDSALVKLLKFDSKTNKSTVIGSVYTNKIGYYEFSENTPEVYIQVIPNEKNFPDLPAMYYPGTKNIGEAQLLTLSTGYNHYNFKITNDLDLSVTENFKEQVEISLYPNPADKYFTLKSASKPIDRIEIYSIVGEVIYEASMNNPTFDIGINTDGFHSGIYFVHVHSGGLNSIRKIIINQ